MIRNCKVGAGLVLVGALLAMGVSSTASALPEVIVGSHLVQDSATVDAQAQSSNPTQTTTDEETEEVDASGETDSASN